MADWHWDSANLLAMPKSEEPSPDECSKRRRLAEQTATEAPLRSCGACKAAEQTPLKLLQAQHPSGNKDCFTSNFGGETPVVRVCLNLHTHSKCCSILTQTFGLIQSQSTCTHSCDRLQMLRHQLALHSSTLSSLRVLCTHQLKAHAKQTAARVT